jgi:hypothetical protein
VEVGVLAGLFMLLACVSPASGSAAPAPSWQRDHPIVGSSLLSAISPLAAITDAGDAAVVWRDPGNALNVALGPRRGRFGRARQLSAPGRLAEGFDIVADRRGALVVIWADTVCCETSDERSLWISTRKPGAQFSAPQRLVQSVGGGLLLPRVAAGADGSLAIVWAGADGTIQLANRLPGGGFGPSIAVSPPPAAAEPGHGINSAYAPAVAIGPRGDTLVLWAFLRATGALGCPPSPVSCGSAVFAAVRPARGSFGAPEQLADAGRRDVGSNRIDGIELEVAPDGSVIASWRESFVCLYCLSADIHAAKRSPGGPFGKSQRLGVAYALSRGPRLALDVSGTAHVIWGTANTSRFADDLNPRVLGAEAPAGASFGRAHLLARGGDALGMASAAGPAVAAWTSGAEVTGAVRRPAGYCSQQISRSGGQPPGDVAANHRGDALAVWQAPGERHRLVTALGLADRRRPAIIGFALNRPRVRFALSEAARVRLTLERLERRRFRALSSLVESFPAGPNEVRLDALAGRSGLPRGSYRLLGAARDCSGRPSRTASITFVVGR